LVKAAAGRWLMRWVRFGLARDALFFLVLVVVVLAVVAAAWDRFIVDPRVETAIAPAAAHLGSVAAAASAMPPAERDAFLKDIVQRSEGALALDDPQRWELSEPASALRVRGLAILREQLPDQVIAFSAKGGNMFWLALPGEAADGATWLRMRAAGDDQGRAVLLAAVISGGALFGVAAAFMLGLQTRKQVRGWAATSAPGADASDVPRLEDATIHLRALHALGAQASSAARDSLAQLEQLCERLAVGPMHPVSASAATAQGVPPAPRWTAVRGRLRVDFLADVGTMLVLLGLVLGGLGLTFDRLIAQPRFETSADFVAIQIRGLRNAMQALPPERRQAFLGDIFRSSRGRIAADDPGRWQLAPPQTRLYGVFLSNLREKLPGLVLYTTHDPVRLLWFSLGPGSGPDPNSPEEVWLRVSAVGAAGDPQVMMRSIFAVLVAVAVIVVWRGRQRAERLMLALRRVRDERQAPASSSLDDDVDEAQRAIASDPRLHRSIEEVMRQREKDELGRARLARQAHECIARLRLLRPAGSAGAAFEALLEPMERWIGRIEPHAAVAGAPEADVIDINDVLERVAQYAEVPVRLEQGGVPYVKLSASAALRLLRSLLQGLEPDFAVGVNITSTMDHGWVVVQVRDPVGAASEAQMMAREGIEVARNLASTHGGLLRLVPLPDGGWQGEVWLPCARL
jgi:hypothetical protein